MPALYCWTNSFMAPLTRGIAIARVVAQMAHAHAAGENDEAVRAEFAEWLNSVGPSIVVLEGGGEGWMAGLVSFFEKMPKEEVDFAWSVCVEAELCESYAACGVVLSDDWSPLNRENLGNIMDWEQALLTYLRREEASR